MIIDNHDLYLGFGSDWYEVKTNNKIPIQKEIFVHGLLIVLLILNIVERALYPDSTIKIRISKALITTIVIYFLNFLIYKIFNFKDIWCLFHAPRGNPTFTFLIGLILYLLIFYLILEMIFKSKYYNQFIDLIKKKDKK